MKKRIFTGSLTLIAFLMVILVNATWSINDINQMYIFGDSLSDVGNIFRLTEHERPPSPPYYSGRYSNGPLWVEDLAQQLQLNQKQVNNLAWGGATTQGSFGNIKSLKKQIDNFVTNNPNPNLGSQTLCVIWIGANDYLYGNTNVTTTVKTIIDGIDLLVKTGIKKFLIANLPDLGTLPATRNTEMSGSLTALTKAHNQALSKSIKQLKQDLGPGVEIVEFDVYSLYQQVTKKPAQFGLTNIKDSCLQNTSVCNYPNTFLYWDGVHPTAAAHQILAKTAFLKVEEAHL